MNKGQTIFSQIIDFLPQKKFRQCVARYSGNYRPRSFTCYDQFVSAYLRTPTIPTAVRSDQARGSEAADFCNRLRSQPVAVAQKDDAGKNRASNRWLWQFQTVCRGWRW